MQIDSGAGKGSFCKVCEENDPRRANHIVHKLKAAERLKQAKEAAWKFMKKLEGRLLRRCYTLFQG
jgi:hypothetical protein